MVVIKTASWFTKMPTGHVMIGISRGVPRRIPAGYHIYRKLAPGAWFNSVDAVEYERRYYEEILNKLDPKAVAAELYARTSGEIPVLVCYEKAGGPSWCHRAMTAEWLSKGTGELVIELGYEDAMSDFHPLMPREVIAARRR